MSKPRIRPADEWASGEPGLYAGVPDAAYRAAFGISQSAISPMAESPLAYRFAQDNPPDDNPNFAFGRAAHARVLTPDVFSAEFDVQGGCAGQLKDGRDCSYRGQVRVAGRWFCNRHAPDDDHDRIEVVSDGDAAKIEAMATRAVTHPVSKALLAHAPLRELSMRCKDPATGLILKGRVDAYGPDARLMVDYKTTGKTDLRPGDVYAYGYHRQAAMYLRIARELGLRLNDFVLLFQSKRPPYDMIPTRVKASAIEAGSDQLDDLLRKLVSCMESDTWPGRYEDAVIDLDIPEWAYSNIYEEITHV